MENKKISDKAFKIIMLVCAAIVALSIVIIVIANMMDAKTKKMKLEHYSQNVATYLEQIENITSYSVSDGYVNIYVDDTWYQGNDKDREDYVKAIQDTLTALLSKSKLNNGYYQTLYVQNSNNQRVATANYLGVIEIK